MNFFAFSLPLKYSKTLRNKKKTVKADLQKIRRDGNYWVEKEDMSVEERPCGVLILI
jgi:hypothetical protein